MGENGSPAKVFGSMSFAGDVVAKPSGRGFGDDQFCPKFPAGWAHKPLVFGVCESSERRSEERDFFVSEKKVSISIWRKGEVRHLRDRKRREAAIARALWKRSSRSEKGSGLILCGEFRG
jgi:hypothetical protein